MKRRRSLVVILSLAAVLGCGFESKVQGDWKIDPATWTSKEVRRAGVPPELLKSLQDMVLVVDDGVVYLGVAHPDSAAFEYEIGHTKGDCADVDVTAQGEKGKEKARIEACLVDDDRLELTYEEGNKPLSVALERVSR
jgi:hypothetical protein